MIRNPGLILVFALVVPLLRAESPPVRDLLDRYTGRWVGSYTVLSLDGEVLQRLKVEQQYWWDGEEQRGVGAYDRQGELVWISSRTYFRGEALLCEISIADQPPRTYAARVRGETITWLPTHVLEATHKQVRETIVSEGGRTLLRSEGFEHIGPPDRRMPVRVVGELERMP